MEEQRSVDLPDENRHAGLTHSTFWYLSLYVSGAQINRSNRECLHCICLSYDPVAVLVIYGFGIDVTSRCTVLHIYDVCFTWRAHDAGAILGHIC